VEAHDVVADKTALNEAITKTARKRKMQARKEQLSQGVLRQLNYMLGRIVESQVQASINFLFLFLVHPID
jgi:hypothetical protein